MFPRWKKFLLFMVLFLFLISFNSFFAQEYEELEIKVEKAGDGVYVLFGAGGNIGVSIGRDGTLLVDSQFAELNDKVTAAIKAIKGVPIRYVLNTNWHYDHVGGNKPLAEGGAIIIAQTDTRKRMITEQYHPLFDTTVPPYPEAALPTVTFAKSITLDFNGGDIHAFHIENAHSDSDIVIHFKNANVIHTGDIVFSAGFPFIDRPHGGSVEGMIKAANQIIEMMDEETKIIPGHGPLTDREGVKKFRDLIITVRDRIKKQIGEGRTLDEILATNPTEGFEMKGPGVPAEMFVRIIYNELSGQ
ncbi:MAG: MBL fold metallo-hydrolase [Candidatus Aminicenantes bacterium]|jgi:glyoxylase-like metal-dependent hydrolase (beta-lactamase superfamily II)